MKNYSLLFLGLMVLLFNSKLKSQEFEEPTRSKNTINVSLMGLGGFTSLNYERNLYFSNNGFLVVRSGLGSNFKSLTFPHAISFNVGNNFHFFEFGYGGSFVLDSEGEYVSKGLVGYRFHKIWKGLSFTIRYLPTFYSTRSSASLDLGIWVVETGIGYTF